MARKTEQQERWLLATSIALSSLVLVYFLLLFPKETSTVFQQYLNYIVVVVIVLLAVTLTRLLIKRLNNKNVVIQYIKEERGIKTAEQLIWRNRYVLQAKKSQLQISNAPESKALWHEEKVNFAKKHIYPTVPEADVSLQLVSELIEKSLRGTDIGSVQPPTYSVRNINN